MTPTERSTLTFLRFRAARSRATFSPLLTISTAAGEAERCQHLDDALGLRLRELDAIDDRRPHGLRWRSASTERATLRDGARRNAIAVVTRLRAEHHRTTHPDRRAVAARARGRCPSAHGLAPPPETKTRASWWRACRHGGSPAVNDLVDEVLARLLAEQARQRDVALAAAVGPAQRARISVVDRSLLNSSDRTDDRRIRHASQERRRGRGSGLVRAHLNHRQVARRRRGRCRADRPCAALEDATRVRAACRSSRRAGSTRACRAIRGSRGEAVRA